jgi:O-antigen/teichoic acid export membrane protein
MVMGIILARLLMPEDFGRFAYISAVVTALMIPFGMTVTPLLVIDGGRNPSLFGNVLGFMCITSALKLIVLCAFIIYQLAAHQPLEALLAFLIGLPVALYDLPEALRADLEGQGRFGPNLAVQLANLATHAVVSIGLVLLGWGVYGLALGGFAAYWPQLLLYLGVGKRRIAEARFKWPEIRSLTKSGLSFWTAQFSTNMSTRVDKIFLGELGGEV